jgi:hypothetical protein
MASTWPANMQFLQVARFPGLGEPMPRTGNGVPGIADITSVNLRKVESFPIGTSFAHRPVALRSATSMTDRLVGTQRSPTAKVGCGTGIVANP